MVKDDLVAYRDETLVCALAAFSAGPECAEPGLPLVGTRWRVAGSPGSLTHKARGEDIRPSSKEGSEQAHLLGRGLRGVATRFPCVKRQWGRDRCRIELRFQRGDSSERLLPSPIELTKPHLLASNFLQNVILCACHRSKFRQVKVLTFQGVNRGSSSRLDSECLLPDMPATKLYQTTNCSATACRRCADGWPPRIETWATSELAQ